MCKSLGGLEAGTEKCAGLSVETANSSGGEATAISDKPLLVGRCSV